MSKDDITEFKEAQRQGWKHFAPLEALTTPAAARLVKFANVRAGENLLDVGCGTGVAAITAARVGARARGVDLTPELLEPVLKAIAAEIDLVLRHRVEHERVVGIRRMCEG